MKNYPRFFLLALSILFIVLGTNALMAQVTFTEPDSGRVYGITFGGGLMGFAWGDYDGDGDLDLVVCHGAGNSTLYRNDFRDSMKFERVSQQTANDTLGKILYDRGGQGGYCAFFADLNGDGSLDLASGMLRIFPNYLADSAKFGWQRDLYTSSTTAGGWGHTAGDFDRDGDVDIACATGTGSNYLGPIYIWRNEGNFSFVDQAINLIGIEIRLESWNPQWVDVDNDGYLDLWIPVIRTTGEICYLIYNDLATTGMMTPHDPTVSGIVSKSAITSSWADYDNDGDLDLFLTTLSADNDGNAKLFRNNGDRTFTNVTSNYPVLDSLKGYTDCRGLSWGDYDNDGDQDLYMQRLTTGARSLLFRNDNNGAAFVDVTEEVGLSKISTADRRTATFVDYDNDGWLDIFFKHNGTPPPPRLFHNNGGNSNHWIVFRPQSTTANSAGIGARVTVVTGSLRQIRYVQAGAAGGCNGQMFPHFGLGSATKIDSVIVDWPYPIGSRDVSTNVPVDQYCKLVQGTGVVTSVNQTNNVPSGFALSQNYPNPFNPTTTIEFSLPVRSDVQLTVVNVLGQVVKELSNQEYSAGTHKVTLDASNLATGVYFYKLQAGSFVNVKKLVLMK